MKKIDLSDNSLVIAQKRYFDKGEDWEACCRRVADVVSSCELKSRDTYRDIFFEMIYKQDFLPGGRILRNSGRPRGSLFNCYHLPIGDSIDEIGECLKHSLILWSEGGGVGINFSPLRPEGDAILGKGGASSGLVSFMKAFNATGNTIQSGGARRAAAIGHIDVSHPELFKFIDAKTTKIYDELLQYLKPEIFKEAPDLVELLKQKLKSELSQFNISVSVNDIFLDVVESDGDWTFNFKQKKYDTVKAREVWQKIIVNMIECAEPGLINWTNFIKNNSYYFEPVLGTNPCGETTLGPYGACDLGSIVLPNFIPEGGTNTNWKRLRQIVHAAVRFLDNVIEVNKYILKEIDIKAHNSRRIGIGVIGLAEYLFAKKARYGSDKAVAETERVIRAIRDYAYEASVELAIEKGAFPMYDPIPFSKASFVRKLPATLRRSIKKHGIRNCTLMALAPTGTISLLTPYMSGIEPLFAKAMVRSDRVSERLYVHPKYEELVTNREDVPEWFVDSFDLEPKDHFEIQAACQKFCDGSVSKTVNMPKDTTPEQLGDLLLEYIHDLKGVTVYVDGSREGQILNRASDDEVRKYLKNKKDKIESELHEGDVICATGACEL
jgi:ribonucleoside-diphosphate reductase alpha chain